jgi:hypothetical protein
MKTTVLTGPKEQIAEEVIRISGDVVRAIVFVEEAGERSAPRAAPSVDAWLRAFQDTLDNAVAVGQDVDDSRDSIYRGCAE